MLTQRQAFDLFPTPVVTYQIEKSSEWNQALVNVVDDYVNNHMRAMDASGFKASTPYNILANYKSPELLELFDLLTQAFWDYLGTKAGLTQNDINTPSVNMFGNREGFNGSTVDFAIPHAHHGNQVVLTYYPRVIREAGELHSLAGNFKFLNPLPLAAQFWARKVPNYKSISTQAGTLICFPGNALHATVPFFKPGSRKWALITNWQFAPKSAGEQSAYVKVDEIRQFQTRDQ